MFLNVFIALFIVTSYSAVLQPMDRQFKEHYDDVEHLISVCDFLSGGASCFVYMNYSTCREPGGNISIDCNGSNNFMWPQQSQAFGQ